MSIELNIIAGVMLGIEYVPWHSIEDAEEGDPSYLVLDLFMFRILFTFG
jgi:hypothetical protein